MKKQLTFIFLLASFFSFAQSDILFTVTSGTTYSNIRGNDVAEQNKYDFNYVG